MLNRKTIWNFSQNRPILIARDLPEIPQERVFEILLKRGVFKWFAVRRALIRLKNTWRDRITSVNLLLRDRNYEDHSRDWYRGYLACAEAFRAEVRALCHSDRWQAPDNDRHARRFLEDLETEV